MSISEKLTPSEKVSLVMQLTDEADYTRALMEQARKKGQHNVALQYEEELEAQDSYIRAVEDDCA